MYDSGRYHNKRELSVIKKILLLPVFFVLASCVDDEIKISGCEPVGDIRPVCGMQTPEDIAALPDGQHLLLANFGGMKEGSAGKLSLFDTETEKSTLLYPVYAGDARVRGNAWGDRECERPTKSNFSPHGTHLHRLANGKLRYLVVNHGGRESIEIFNVKGRGSATRLAWRGCVLAPEDTIINDVVGLSNGDVIYSRMLHGRGKIEQIMSLFGKNTGDLWRWNKESGPRKLPGTEANQPNGLEISPDERHVFANMYMTGEVWKVDVDTGEVVATAPVANADNSAWGSDGRLWVVTHTEGLVNILSCFSAQDKACGARFEIFALDPETMAVESLFEHRGAPMGAATVAVPQAGRVYMGSFVGDRLMSVPDFSLTSQPEP
jgi:hypothetical protein